MSSIAARPGSGASADGLRRSAISASRAAPSARIARRAASKPTPTVGSPAVKMQRARVSARSSPEAPAS